MSFLEGYLRAAEAAKAAEPGDEVSVLIKVKVLPGGFPLQFRELSNGGSGTLEFTNADISVEHVSQFRNGVHIDSEGKYWMRRPSGWYRMLILGPKKDFKMWDPHSKPAFPVQRLKEVKD